MVKTSVFAFDGRHDEKQEPKGQFREWLLQSSQPWQSRQHPLQQYQVLNVG